MKEINQYRLCSYIYIRSNSEYFQKNANFTCEDKPVSKILICSVYSETSASKSFMRLFKLDVSFSFSSVNFVLLLLQR